MSSSSSSSTDSEIEEAAALFSVPEPTDELHVNEPLPGALFRRRQQKRHEGGQVDEEEAVARPASPVRLNCSCNNCVEWVNMKDCEKRCCNDIPEIRSLMADAQLAEKCMVEHPDFDLVISNDTVQRITMATFDRQTKARVSETPMHKQRRYVAYCNMSRWIYRILGRGNRVPLAACVVDTIRKRHPPPLVHADVYGTDNYPEFVNFQDAPVQEMEVDELENDGMPILRGDDE